LGLEGIFHLERQPFTISARQLLDEVGAPFVHGVRIVLGDDVPDAGGPDPVLLAVPDLGRRLGPLVPLPFPPPARRLKFSELAQIEATLQAVLADPMRYTRAVWLSMTAEERALLLDAYTLGFPGAAANDPTLDVPLLDCVDNNLLG